MVVASHPHANVIVQTHAYLTSTGEISSHDGGYGATSPRFLFDSLISVYPNIVMVFSGHTGIAASRTDVGVHGNRIFSFLQTFHSRTTNPVRLVNIDTAKGTLSSRIYAPKDNGTYAPFDDSYIGVSFVR